MPKPDLSYAIIGGGISGIALAIALHRSGVDVRIFEQASQFKASGAGVSFTPNALQAMQVCHPAIYEAFQRVCTRNIWPSKQKVWFDYYDHHHASHHGKPAFSITNQFGQNSVHRARFIDELVKLLPADMVSFDKRLDRYEEQDGGRYRLHFADGSTHVADGILACDGIKSRVRQLMFRAGHPCATPSYTYKYAYRALVPMEDAVWAMGEEKAQNAAMHVWAPTGKSRRAAGETQDVWWLTKNMGAVACSWARAATSSRSPSTTAKPSTWWPFAPRSGTGPTAPG